MSVEINDDSVMLPDAKLFTWFQRHTCPSHQNRPRVNFLHEGHNVFPYPAVFACVSSQTSLSADTPVNIGNCFAGSNAVYSALS